jgi:urease accessory protein
VTGAAVRVGRDGALALGFERRGDRTVLARCRSAVPLQVLAPVALEDPAAVVSILNPTGGLLGGDRLTMEIDVGPGAHACLTTPSATRVYRTAGEPAVQHVHLRLGAGAIAEWVPDHTIPHAGSALQQVLEAEVAEGAALVLVDAFAAGRVARGEAWRFAALDSALAVRDACGWLLLDRLRLAGGVPRDGLGLAEGAPYFASVLVIADTDPAPWVREVQDVRGRGDAVAAAALARRGALARVLAPDAPALTARVAAAWRAARRLLGLPALHLRKS